MADAKISALPSATAPLDVSVPAPVVQSSTTKKATVGDILNQKKTGTGIPVMMKLWGGADGVGTPDGAAIALAGSTGEHTAYIKGYHAGFGKASIGMFVDNYGGSKNPYESFTFSPEGNLVPNVAAKGVNFTANTPAAGMTSQLLNWYEEGTWTGTLVVKGSGTAGTYTPTAASTFATYTRVGRVVTLQLQIGGFDAASGGTGDLIVTGLPFTKAANSGYTATVWLFNATFPASTAGVIGRPSTSAGTSSTMEFYALVSGGGTTIPISAVGTSTQLSFNVSYIV